MSISQLRSYMAIIFLAFLGAVFCLSFGQTTLFADQSIRIGEIDPLTGKLAKHGIEIHEGILFAVEQANAEGGFHGRIVKLISRDDQSLPDVAVNQVEDLLLREKVVGLVGGYVDSLVGPVSQLAMKYHVPYVASASLQKALTRSRRNSFFFRVSRLDGIVRPLCGFLNEVVKPAKVAIIYASTPGATEFSREVQRCLKQQGTSLSLVEKFRPGTPDFSSFLLRLKQSGTDVLIAAGFFPDHLILVRQIRELQIPLKAYVGPWGVAYKSFITTLGKMSENLIGMSAWSPSICAPGTEKESLRFLEAFRQRFHKDPTSTTMHGYTSAKALLLAIKNVLDEHRALNGETIKKALRNLDVLLPMERLKFDQWGDPLYYQQVIVQIQKGQILPIYPPERARARFIETRFVF